MPSDYKKIREDNIRRRGEEFDDIGHLISEQLYSDRSHFVYELLQNAEDALERRFRQNPNHRSHCAVQFRLFHNRLEFRHFGEPFNKEDVEGISDVLKGTKTEDFAQIGKFGIGFKSVYAFTASPEIHSGDEHFVIKRYIRPEAKEPNPCLLIEPHETVFVFPFDHTDLSAEDAFNLILNKLQELGPRVLLFLRRIDEIKWSVEPDGENGQYIKETKKDDICKIAHRVTVTSEKDDHEKEESWLIFERPVTVPDNSRQILVEVGFRIETNSKNKKDRIVRVDRSPLVVYFPTEKDTRLGFLIQGPYRTTTARDNIRSDDGWNKQLITETAELMEDMLPQIRKKGLLTTKFLAVLPNEDDELGNFYKPIMDRLVELFNNEKLTPMKRGGHAAAKSAFRESRESKKLSDLIDDKDLAKILGDGHSSPSWIKNPQSGSREDRFLSMLEVKEWTTRDLVDKLSEESEMIKTWLKDKPDEWHQKFYALLGDFCTCPRYASEYSKYRYIDRKDSLSNLRIVRLSDGATYKKGKDCYFPSDDVEHDEKFPRVAKGVYSSGKNKDQQEEARKFLKDIGVSEVGEVNQVEAILKQRYVKGTINLRKQHHEEDLKRFITLIEDTPSQANLFKGYFIFELDNEHWGKPYAHVFVDLPYLDTGLRAYYEALGKNSNRKRALSLKYEKYGIKPEKLGKFAEMVGAQIKLSDEVEEQEIPYRHPERDYLFGAPGERKRNEINTDYTIPAFKVLLDSPNLDKARLIWRTMDSLSSIYLTAKYRKSESGGFHYAGSSLVYELRKAKWVPQEHGESLRFVRPCDASNKLLPEDFSHHPRREWIRKVEFGENARKKSEDHITLTRNAREMGFDNEDDAKKWAELKKMGISPDEVLSKFMSSPEFPTSSVSNLERRQARITEQHHDAPKKKYELKQRSVRTTEIDRRTYLENQYTNDDDQMICQICQEEMPFKQRDGEYYFETKEALSGDYFAKEHEAQFLALCPECAARYTEFVKNDEDAMKKVYDFLKNSDALEIILQLGELKTSPRSLRFVETHRQDIRTILQNE